MKKIISMACIAMLVICMALPVWAAEEGTISPRYNGIRHVTAQIGINESTGMATCEGEVSVYYAMPAELLIQLQVYKDGRWKTLMSWSATGTGSVSMTKYYTVESGYEYRAYVTGYLNDDMDLPLESATATDSIFYPST